MGYIICTIELCVTFCIFLCCKWNCYIFFAGYYFFEWVFSRNNKIFKLNEGNYLVYDWMLHLDIDLPGQNKLFISKNLCSYYRWYGQKTRNYTVLAKSLVFLFWVTQLRPGSMKIVPCCLEHMLKTSGKTFLMLICRHPIICVGLVTLLFLSILVYWLIFKGISSKEYTRMLVNHQKIFAQ